MGKVDTEPVWGFAFKLLESIYYFERLQDLGNKFELDEKETKEKEKLEAVVRGITELSKKTNRLVPLNFIDIDSYEASAANEEYKHLWSILETVYVSIKQRNISHAKQRMLFKKLIPKKYADKIEILLAHGDEISKHTYRTGGGPRQFAKLKAANLLGLFSSDTFKKRAKKYNLDSSKAGWDSEFRKWFKNLNRQEKDEIFKDSNAKSRLKTDFEKNKESHIEEKFKEYRLERLRKASNLLDEMFASGSLSKLKD